MTEVLPIEVAGLRDRPATQDTDALLRLIASTPASARTAHDRRTVVAAIVAEARSNRGLIDLNRVRARLTDPATEELVVTPQLVGAVVFALTRAGAIKHHHWTVTTGSRSGNDGRPARVYRLTRKA